MNHYGEDFPPLLPRPVLSPHMIIEKKISIECGFPIGNHLIGILHIYLPEWTHTLQSEICVDLPHAHVWDLWGIYTVCHRRVYVWRASWMVHRMFVRTHSSVLKQCSSLGKLRPLKVNMSPLPCNHMHACPSSFSRQTISRSAQQKADDFCRSAA